MQTRQLGNEKHNLLVSAIGLGCMGMSHQYGVADEVKSLSVLNKSLDLGINFWDSSDSYGPYLNEELLSQVLKTRRKDVIIATKFGQQFHADGKRTINGSPEYVKSACDASLKRLKIDQIDLYYQHRVDPSIPIEETWGAMSELVANGKVRFLGISEASAATIRKAHAVHQVTAVQTEWSIWSRNIEKNDIWKTVQECGIGLVAYSPLGRGFLTGTIRSSAQLADNDGRKTWPRFQEAAIAENIKLIERLEAVASKNECTLSQLALRWVLAKGQNVVPIAGTTQVENLISNAQAIERSLDLETIADIDAISAEIEIVGDRYPEMMMKAVEI
jgi:aryl-alcohol dehydrogenase-like predicted oxidoreductase